jgi:hypothetical protein
MAVRVRRERTLADHHLTQIGGTARFANVEAGSLGVTDP